MTLRIRKFALRTLLPASLLLAGCDDFLERSAQTLVVPKTTAQYKEILQGEGYFRDLLNNVSSRGGYHFLQFMTDDVEFFDVATDPQCPPDWKNTKLGEVAEVERYANCYRWEVSVESQSQTDGAYLYLYRQAMVANICLEGLEGSEGSQTEKEVLLGQASFSRAFAYFMLANIYAKPYNIARPQDLCVPLKTDPTPTVETYSRATMEQVWTQITGDIEAALKNLKDKGLERNVYEISHPAALILAQRIALYMEDWQSAIGYGQEYMETYAARYPIYDITDKETAEPRVADDFHPYVEKFINHENTEIVWGFGGNNYYAYIISPMQLSIIPTLGKYYRVSSKIENNLIGAYEPGDRRKAYCFFHPTGTGIHASARFDYLTIKGDNSSSSQNKFQACMALRSAEVWLNLAEALARQPQPDPSAAVELLNQLRQKRFDPALYAPISAAGFASTDSLVQYIWTERRRELCFEENHRWWDLRRTTRPKIVHPWRDRTAYVLEENDPAYTLNFPEAELTFNGSDLKPNQRPRRSPIPYNP
ncbi:MAG: RagB/SusD family nutrient uptake outer membrane protein [Prevotellaceae bacterium]|nr:RagB/SusD family nutrient uptake outer membrane protein [Prevotellaceae bacterium]